MTNKIKEFLHLNPNRLDQNINIFFLVIPIITFVLGLALIFGLTNKSQAVAISETSTQVLGSEDQQ